MIDRIKCLFGRHRYIHLADKLEGQRWRVRECTRCGRRWRLHRFDWQHVWIREGK